MEQVVSPTELLVPEEILDFLLQIEGLRFEQAGFVNGIIHSFKIRGGQFVKDAYPKYLAISSGDTYIPNLHGCDTPLIVETPSDTPIDFVEMIEATDADRVDPFTGKPVNHSQRLARGMGIHFRGLIPGGDVTPEQIVVIPSDYEDYLIVITFEGTIIKVYRDGGMESLNKDAFFQSAHTALYAELLGYTQVEG